MFGTPRRAGRAGGSPAADRVRRRPRDRTPRSRRRPRRAAAAVWELAGPIRDAEPARACSRSDPYPLARLIAASALARGESRGVHRRFDFPRPPTRRSTSATTSSGPTSRLRLDRWPPERVRDSRPTRRSLNPSLTVVGTRFNVPTVTLSAAGGFHGPRKGSGNPCINSVDRSTGSLPRGSSTTTDCELRQQAAVLSACEATMRRLLNDRRYFAKPTKALFSELRGHFPISEQLFVFQVVDRNVKLALRYLDRSGRRAGADRRAGMQGAHAPRHALPARAAAGTRLLPVPQAPRGGRHGRTPHQLERTRSQLQLVAH